ncbi:MAG: ABC transporter ATP-binding protein [Porticoccaceae bacterium]|nr:MAG: ABC transporter ATP-binding protein [Porticoccaceae bacterium]
MDCVIRVRGLSKTYPGGHRALAGVDLDVRRGEIFALLGPNGAGKTTLIGILCGTVLPGPGRIWVDGCELPRDWRTARGKIGLVPQELATDAFERVLPAVRFSRALFGKPPDEAYLERLLRDLALWEKRNARILELSGGMKRRLLIAKALSHEPRILFLDEPTAGVDVELRRSLWAMVRGLRDKGVTVILTTHYIEEAEELADRIGILSGGRLLLVEEKGALLNRFGRQRLEIQLAEPIAAVPAPLAAFGLELRDQGRTLACTFSGREGHEQVPRLLRALFDCGLDFRNLRTRESTLEEIFVELVENGA